MSKAPMPSDNYIVVPSIIQWPDSDLKLAFITAPNAVPILFFKKQWPKEEADG